MRGLGYKEGFGHSSAFGRERISAMWMRSFLSEQVRRLIGVLSMITRPLDVLPPLKSTGTRFNPLPQNDDPPRHKIIGLVSLASLSLFLHSLQNLFSEFRLVDDPHPAL